MDAYAIKSQFAKEFKQTLQGNNFTVENFNSAEEPLYLTDLTFSHSLRCFNCSNVTIIIH